MLQEPGISGKCWEQHRDFWKHASDSTGLSWHSEKLNVLLFHAGGQEAAFCTTTTTLPCSIDNGTSRDGHTGTWNSTSFPHRLPPTSSFQFLRESVEYQARIWWLNENIQMFCPRGQARWKQSQTPASLRHWDAFCHSRERTATERFLQQTQPFTWENTTSWYSLLAEVFSRALLTRTA